MAKSVPSLVRVSEPLLKEGTLHESAIQLSTPFSEFLRKPPDWFLVFVPLSVALEHLGKGPAPLLFFSAALAIIPIAALIVHATVTYVSNVYKYYVAFKLVVERQEQKRSASARKG